MYSGGRDVRISTGRGISTSEHFIWCRVSGLAQIYREGRDSPKTKQFKRLRSGWVGTADREERGISMKKYFRCRQERVNFLR